MIDLLTREAPKVEIKKSAPIRWSVHDGGTLLARSTVNVIIAGNAAFALEKQSTQIILALGHMLFITYEWEAGLLPGPLTSWTVPFPDPIKVGPGETLTLKWPLPVLRW